MAEFLQIFAANSPAHIPASLCALKFDHNSHRHLRLLLDDAQLSEYSGSSNTYFKKSI